MTAAAVEFENLAQFQARNVLGLPDARVKRATASIRFYLFRFFESWKILPERPTDLVGAPSARRLAACSRQGLTGS
jgi:hypothetical protein